MQVAGQAGRRRPEVRRGLLRDRADHVLADVDDERVAAERRPRPADDVGDTSDDALPRPIRRKELREEIGADPELPVVLVSAGGWGTGGVVDAVRAIASPRHTTLVLCGRNERLRHGLRDVGPSVVATGWRDDLPRLMRACDVLVENAAGQTAMEAFAVGLPVVSFRPLPGHGRAGVLRMADLGLTSFAADDEALQRRVAELALPGSTRAAGQIERGRALFTADPAAILGAVAVRVWRSPHR